MSVLSIFEYLRLQFIYVLRIYVKIIFLKINVENEI